MMPNPEQLKGFIRNVLPLIAGVLGFSLSDASVALWSGVAATVISAVWSMLTHSESNAVNIVGIIAERAGSAVKGVILQPTAVGVALDRDTPPTVAVAGSTRATDMAARP